MTRTCKLLVAFAIVIAAACADRAPSGSMSAAAGKPPVVTVVTLAPEPAQRALVAVGSLEPIARVLVAAQEEGLVTAVVPREGDRVRSGEVLIRLDDRRLRAELTEAEAVNEEARARRRRIAELEEAGLSSAQELDSALASSRVAEARVDALRTRLSFTRIEAPVDGTVVARHVEVGDLASTRSPLLELAAGSGMLLRVPVSELEVVRLRNGDRAEIRVDALPDLVLDGQVARIYPAADAATRQVTVELVVPSPPPDVRFGFLARARLVLQNIPEALFVPEAVVQRGADLGSFVWVVDDGVARSRSVIPGLREAGRVQLVSGVQPGDRVVVEGLGRLREGIAVEIAQPRDEVTGGAS